MKLFQAILGADTKILTEDETVEGYLGKEFTDAQNSANSESWDIEFKNELSAIRKNEPEILDAAIGLPQRCRIGRKNINYKHAKQDLLAQELFEDIKEKGVLLFSKKGDAFRFCFTAQDGSTTMVSPQQALTLFKSKRDEKGDKVSDAFYPMYEKAKSESGVVKSAAKNGTTNQEACRILFFLKGKATKETDSEYLESIINVISWDSIPEFYVRKISHIKPNDTDALEQIKEIIPASYLNSLIEKEHKVGSEPETILLAEELK